MRTRNVIFTALLAGAVLASGVSAQQGNQSDVTGITVTTFLGGFQSGTSITITPAGLTFLVATMNALDFGLQNNTLVASNGTPIPMSSETANTLRSLLSTDNPISRVLVARILTTWASTYGGSGPSPMPGLGTSSLLAPWPYAGMGNTAVGSPAPVDEAAEELVAALSGLFAAFAATDAGDIEIRPTERLIHAVDEWNEFLDTLPEEALRNPDPVYLAIHTILLQLVAAVDATDDVGIEIDDIGEVEGQEDE